MSTSQASLLTDAPGGDPVGDDGALPYAIAAPTVHAIPFVYNSPHSGSAFPDDFVAASRLDRRDLRRSEDCFVDELFAAAPELGAPLMSARLSRAYLDVNREPWEIDPAMFEEPLPAHANTGSFRVNGGFGTIARVVADGSEIYAAKLPVAEAERRIAAIHVPYHAALTALLEETRARFGCAVLVDCHSMPAQETTRGAGARPGIVLGDRFAKACSPLLMERAEETLLGLGYTVARNAPYAGGYSTLRYGHPAAGLHALQIEIGRELYMDESCLAPNGGFARVGRDMTALMAALAEISHDALR